jgi:hypothetical protein
MAMLSKLPSRSCELLTHGFVGCELLFVELDDSFAEDPNILPLIEEAKASLDDMF